MSNRSPRHRHFVAFPLFLGVLSLSCIPVTHRSSSFTASAISAQSVQTLADGSQVLAGEDSVLDTSGAAPFLRRGSALVQSKSIVQVRTASCDILAIHGAFHVVAGDTSTTVSALTAPVLVSVAGSRAVVPVGLQMRIAGPLTGLEAGFATWSASRSTAALPEHFIREHILSLQQFPSAPDALPEAQSLFPSTESHSGLELPAARERSDQAWRLKVLGALRWRIEQKDIEGASAILEESAYRTALADPRSLSALVTLAGQTEDGAAGLRPSLLRFLADRHDLWLLAALHPDFHTGAWTGGVPALTQEELALLAFDFPHADRASTGFSPVVVRWWEQAVAAFIAEQKDQLSLVEPLVRDLAPVVRQDIADGYPERAQILTHALTGFAKSVLNRLPDDLRASLEDLEHKTEQRADLFAAPVVASSASSASSVSSVSSLPPMDPHERVSVVTSALEQGGALFSLQTKIEPKQDGQSVVVRDILFSSPKGDLTYTFDVDVRTMQVSSIVQNGKLLPYPMALDAFLAWARR